MSYEEILGSMKEDYFNQTGKNIAHGTKDEKEMEILASELFNISCYGDFILKQMMPQTADGEYLDMHANLRGCKRKSASKATGSVTFSIGEAQDSDIVIKKATVCSVAGLPYIQYETVSDTVLRAGELSCNADIAAIDFGEQYNTDANTITVMVNAPVCISAVINYAPVTGGRDTESDEALRKRIIDSYYSPNNGLSRESIQNAVMTLDRIRDCKVLNSNERGTLSVVVDVDNDNLDSGLIAQIKDKISFAEFIGVEVNITKAQVKEYTLSVSLCYNKGGIMEDESEQIRQEITEYCSGKRIGQSINLSSIVKIISQHSRIADSEVYGTNAVNSYIDCNENERCVLKAVNIINYEK